MELKKFVDWGIPGLHANLHLPNNTFNILQTPDEESSLIAIAHFLETGLNNNEKVALTSFSNPSETQKLFQQFGFNFNDALESEDFFYLYYLPDFSQTTSFTTDYKDLFQEIEKMCLDKVDRVAFASANSLINLQNHNLALSTSQKLAAAANCLPYTVLGTFYESDSMSSRLLDTASKNFPSYFEMTKTSGEQNQHYRLDIKKSLVLNRAKTIELKLSSGEGFIKNNNNTKDSNENVA